MQVLYEPAKDTVCLMGWAPGLIVVTFRGTASLANVRADLSVSNICHGFQQACIQEGMSPCLLHSSSDLSGQEQAFQATSTA